MRVPEESIEQAIVHAQHILIRGGAITLEWDAGGDDTLVWATVRPEEESPEWFRDAIEAAVADALVLPNGGPVFDRGGAYLEAGPNQRPVLVSNSYRICEIDCAFDEKNLRLRYYDPPNGIRREFTVTNWEDPGDMQGLFSRTELRLVGMLDFAGNQCVLLKLDVVSGDDVDLPARARQYYEERVRALLSDLYEEFVDQFAEQLDPKTESLPGLYIEGTSRRVSGADFFLQTNAFDSMRLLDGARIEL